MHGTAFGQVSAVVDGGPDERVPERHPLRDGQQPGRLDVTVHAQRGRRAPQQHRVTDRVGGGEQQHQPGLRRQPVHPAPETLLDPPRRVQQAEPAGQRRRIGQRQLQQRERVATGLGEDRGAHPLVERPAHHRVEQAPCRAVGQTADGELGQPVEAGQRGAAGEDHQHRLGAEPPRHERQDLRGRGVEPLRVVDHADHRPVPGRLGEQIEHAEPDQERARDTTGTQPEDRLDRLGLRAGKPGQVLQQRHAELVQGGERQLHLGLDTTGADHLQIRRGLTDVGEQRRLADPRLTDQHDRVAAAVADRGQRPVESRAFRSAAEQHRIASPVFPRAAC